MATITESEVLEALAEAARADAPEGARTADELAAAAGVSIMLTRRALRKLQADGRLVVARARRTRLDGQGYSVPVYTVRPR